MIPVADLVTTQISGADLEARTRRGWTPLMLAVGEDDLPLVELLLENGEWTSVCLHLYEAVIH